MTKFRKARKYIILAALIIVAAWIYFAVAKKPQVQYVTAKAQVGTLMQTVTETGTVKRASDVNLNFLNQGRISKLAAKVGDKVRQGQTLAELDYSNLQIQARQISASLEIAKANELKVLRGAASQDVVIGQTGVTQAATGYVNAKKDYDRVKQSTDEAIRQAEKTLNDQLNAIGANSPTVQAVKSAETSLANTRSTYQKALDNRIASALVLIRDKNTAAKTALDAVNRVIDDENIKDTLSIKDLSKLVMAKAGYTASMASRTDAEDAYSRASQQPTSANVQAAFSASRRYSSDVLDTVAFTFGALENSITSIKFSQANLDAFKSSISTQSNLVNASIASLESADQSISDAKLNYDTAVASAEHALAAARAGLDSGIQAARNALNSARLSQTQQLQSAQSRVDAAYDNWQIAKAQLNKTTAGARSEDLMLAAAQVKQAQANLDAINNQIGNSVIKAPFAGEITQVNYQVGETPTAAQPVIVLLGNDQFEVEVDIAESDIAKVQAGNDVSMTFDAFGDAIEFSGMLAHIDPAQTVIQEVVYYRSRINDIDVVASGTKSYLKQIKSGMTVNATIMAKKLDDALIIPNRAIIEKAGGERIVRVLRDREAVDVQVTVGMRGDEGQTQVLSGLSAGDEVIVSVSGQAP